MTSRRALTTIKRLEDLERGTSAARLVHEGDTSRVFATAGERGAVVCKRLPTLGSATEFDEYADVFSRYLNLVRERGVRVHETQLYPVALADGKVAAWCVQPELAPECLAPRLLRDAAREPGMALFESVLALVGACCDGSIGLDAALSNWALTRGDLVYIDVTTPLMRDPQGQDMLRPELVLGGLSWTRSTLLKMGALRGWLDPYFSVRGATLDLLGRLEEERLDRWAPLFMETANHLLNPPLTFADLRAAQAGAQKRREQLAPLRASMPTGPTA